MIKIISIIQSIITVSMLVVLSDGFLPEDQAFADGAAEEVSVMAKTYGVISASTRNAFNDELPEIDSDESFDQNNPEYGTQGTAITWKPGEFFILTGQQVAANQGLVEVLDDKNFEYYDLEAGDINTTRTFYFNNPYIENQTVEVGATLHEGIVYPDTFTQIDGLKKIFFTLNYWTEYHFAPALIDWDEDNKYDNNAYLYRINSDYKRFYSYAHGNRGQPADLLKANYQHYGKIRPSTDSSLADFLQEDLNIYQQVYHRVYRNNKEYFSINGNKEYKTRNMWLDFSIPNYYQTDTEANTPDNEDMTGYVALNNNIGVGHASINLGRVRLASPRLWVERQSVKENTWMDISNNALWTPERQNKLLIEQYSLSVFLENDYAELTDIGKINNVIYDPDNQSLAYLHIPSAGMYHTHFAVQSCKKLHSNVAVDNAGKEIKTLETITAFDIIHDLKAMAKSPGGITSDEIALDTSTNLKDFYKPHIEGSVFDPEYKDKRQRTTGTSAVPGMYHSRGHDYLRIIDEKFSIWWLAYYFVMVYHQSMEQAQTSSSIGAGDLAMPASGTLSAFQNSLDVNKIKTLIEGFSTLIKRLIVENFYQHPFLATLMSYVMYYNSPTGRVKSCSDLKIGVYNSFYIIDNGQAIRGNSDASNRGIMSFFGTGANGIGDPALTFDDLDQIHVADIRDEVIGLSHYKHKWWEHTNIDFSCVHLKQRFEPVLKGFSSEDAQRMFFLKPLLDDTPETPKSSSEANSKHYSDKLRNTRNAHFPDELIADSFVWQEFLSKNIGNILDGEDYQCSGENKEVDLAVTYAEGSDQKRCKDNHWTKKWMEYREFYYDLAQALKHVAEFDDLQIKLSRSSHHYMDCAPLLSKTDGSSRQSSGSRNFSIKQLRQNNHGKYIQSSASLDAVQDFYDNQPYESPQVQKFYLSKHPEADFAINEELKALYTSSGKGNFDYITFATSLTSEEEDYEPKLAPGRPMVIIPGTKFYEPEIFKRYDKASGKSVSLVVKAFPRSKVTFSPQANIQQGNVNQESIAINVCSITPESDQARIMGELQTKLVEAKLATSDRASKIQDIVGYLEGIKDQLGCVPTEKEIKDAVYIDPRHVVIFAN